MTRKLTIKELKTMLCEPSIAECAIELGVTKKLMDLKVKITGFATGYYEQPVTFTREDLTNAVDELMAEKDSTLAKVFNKKWEK